MLEETLMSENGYITEVKSALLRKGFWGQPVRKLLEELRDHFRAKTETLEAEGCPLPEAHRQAAAALGEPKAIAMEWSRTLQSKNWIARHPLLTLIIGVCGILVYFFISAVIVFYVSGIYDYRSTHQLRFLPLEGWSYLINWMPWVVGMLFLIWRTIRFPSGWKMLFVGCLTLGLGTSAFDVYCVLPRHGGTTGSITLEMQTWTSLWVYPLFYWLHMLREIGGDQEGAWMRVWLCPGLFKLLFPLLVGLMARSIATRLPLSLTTQ